MIDDSLLWLDYVPTHDWPLEEEIRGEKPIIRNLDECKIICRVLEQIAVTITKKTDIAIIVPYRNQVYELRKAVHDYNLLKIEVDTVDGFQGKEADIVIFGVTRTSGTFRFLADPRRLNVALSRAKDRIIIVGNKKYALQHGLFILILQDSEAIIKLSSVKHNVGESTPGTERSKMSKKVVAFTAGRRGGNCEIYVKIALQELSGMGIECEMIRLHECDLRPCLDCPNGPCYSKGPNACVLKDDGPWLAEKFLESDGYLLAAPVWSLSPCGVVTDFRDRVFGPKMDLSQMEAHGIPEWAQGRAKQRPGALISVGGALSEHWTSLGLATLYTTTFSAQTNVIDNINIYQVADPGEALMRKDYITKVRYLAQNLGHAVLNPQKDWENKWLGDLEDGEACPGCHTSLMIAKPGRDYVECAVCGRKGYVALDKDGKLKYTWPEDNRNRLTMMGKFDHVREIERHTAERYEPHKDEIQDELKMYRQMEQFTVKAPSKQK